MKKLLMMALATFLIPLTMCAQQNDSLSSVGARKKVAVVLSGGGAKGMAHIGVLKVIEKAGIPVDIITGTSMGSIIGGLYSIGYNANSLDSMVRKQDWMYVISDKEDLSKQSLAEQRKQYTYPITIGLTIGKKNRDDGGLIRGKNLKELFQTLCTGYTDSLDFSRDLPIPFACVATNIIDNSEVDFHSGYLPQAMRASMAIPAAFSPVRVGDKVLVDGGLRNNYPADVAREMGADIVIGVTVQGAPKMAEDMGNTMSILSQIIDVNCKNKYDENIAITDIPIRVNTTGYGSASFTPNAIDTLIRRGEEEAMLHWDELMALKKRIGIDDSFRPRILHPLRPEVMTEKRRVTAFVFENMTPLDERFIRHKFNLDQVDSIDVAMQQNLTTSMRVDLFYQSADCQLRTDGDGVKVVLTAGHRKSAQLHAALRYDSEEYAALQVEADIPLKGQIPLNTDITLRLGKRLMAKGELIMHTMTFTNPYLALTFRRNDINIYMKGDRDYDIEYNHMQALFDPFNFNLKHFNMAFGLKWDYVHYRNKLEASHSTPVPLENDHYFTYRAKVNYVSEDNWYFPTRGSRFIAQYAYVTDNFAKLNDKAGMSDVSAHWRTSFTLGTRFTLQPMFYGRLLFGPEVPVFFGNAVGGQWFSHYIEQQMPFAGIGNLEYFNRHFVAAQMQAQQRIGDKHFILLRVAAGQHSSHLKDILKEKTVLGVQASYYFNTIFGPLGASLGYSNYTKKVNAFINLGYVF
ncbi:MAG: patatin-like phospholipase family protein [Prevotella sp.]|nr:patatin-like phospholipase family protein [Prevotella sp.]